ncbi:type II toxin-antitoxin system RelB/DinJ family antitoxin [Pseudomonas sp. NPDC008258]|uniref:type II toxin-antitoxin system RelB/DinJ family antitoxin n=1 Tax=Pseudomonas sp. NPDC008258 TaxID=3364418 RepID=UPI0036E73D81
MASITLRIDDDLMARAYKELERLGVTPSGLMHHALQHVAEQGKLPFEQAQMAEEDEDLIATADERLTSPQRVKITLDDL